MKNYNAFTSQNMYAGEHVEIKSLYNQIIYHYQSNPIACVYCAVSSSEIVLKLYSFNSLGHGNIQLK